jgi:hypothetical protein
VRTPRLRRTITSPPEDPRKPCVGCAHRWQERNSSRSSCARDGHRFECEWPWFPTPAIRRQFTALAWKSGLRGHSAGEDDGDDFGDGRHARIGIFQAATRSCRRVGTISPSLRSPRQTELPSSSWSGQRACACRTTRQSDYLAPSLRKVPPRLTPKTRIVCGIVRVSLFSIQKPRAYARSVRRVGYTSAWPLSRPP